MKSKLKIIKKVPFKAPIMIVGWDWPDAGRAGVEVIEYIRKELKAEKLAEIKAKDFASAPRSTVERGVMTNMTFLENRFDYWIDKENKKEFIFFSSEQPAIHHIKYIDYILEMAKISKVKIIYTVGGLNSNITHNEESVVHSVVNDPSLKEDLKGYPIDNELNYNGSTSMNGLLLWEAKEKKIKAVSLWADVPYYISQLPSPLLEYSKAVFVLLKILRSILDLPLDLSNLETVIEFKKQELDKIVEAAGNLIEKPAKEGEPTIH